MADRNFAPSAPNRTLWILAVIIGIVGILVHYYHVEKLSEYNYEMLLIGFLLLVLGTAFRRM
jgi:hypothetical protein